MTKKHFIFLAATLSFLILSHSSKAQVKNSIYSMYGVGQLTDNSFGINRALGGTGIAFQSGRSINNLNPASYLGILPSSVILEAGVYGIYNKSEDGNISQSDADINFNYFSTNLYFAKWWAFSFGIVPFSSIDYEINTTDEVVGEVSTFEKKITGSGGLNRIYFGNSFRIYGGLSLGFNANFILGPITQTESAAGNETFTGYELKNERTVSGFYLDYGLQYSIKNNDLLYTIGLIYGSSKTLDAEDNLEFSNDRALVIIEEDDNSDLKIPEKFGIGVSVKSGHNFRAGFDYDWNSWSNINFSNPNLDTKNSNRFSIGVEYFPGKNKRDSWLEKIYYRLGANYKNSYLEIDNTRINSMGINFGLGIPYDATSLINLSVEYGQEGTLNKGLIKNSYWAFNLSISLQQFWFQTSNRR